MKKEQKYRQQPAARQRGGEQKGEEWRGEEEGETRVKEGWRKNRAVLRDCGRVRKRMKERKRRDRQREADKTRSSHMTGIDCRQD